MNLADLSKFDDGATVDAAALIKAGLVPDDKQPVKILGNGELAKKLTMKAGWFSKSARQKFAGWRSRPECQGPGRSSSQAEEDFRSRRGPGKPRALSRRSGQGTRPPSDQKKRRAAA